jgi:hypothetical protein
VQPFPLAEQWWGTFELNAHDTHEANATAYNRREPRRRTRPPSHGERTQLNRWAQRCGIPRIHRERGLEFSALPALEIAHARGPGPCARVVISADGFDGHVANSEPDSDAMLREQRTFTTTERERCQDAKRLEEYCGVQRIEPGLECILTYQG